MSYLIRPLTSKKEDIYSKGALILNMKMRGIFLLIIILIILSTTSLGYDVRGGDIFLIRPNSPYIDHGYVPDEYLSVEDLIFYTCIEENNVPVKSTVICMDDNSFKDIEVVRWLDEENCFMGTYNLDSKDCSKMIIQSEYVKDEELVTIQKEVKVNRFSSILDLVSRNQYSDGGWKNSIETAAGIWVLSNFWEIYDDEMSLGIEWLKLARNNDFKCWPNEDCSVRSTAKIMAYLSMAGLNDSYRVMHDGLIFLEQQQNFYLENDLWELRIKPFDSGNTSCLISYEENLYNENNFTLFEETLSTFEFSPVPNEELIVICDQNFAANLTTEDEEIVFIYEGDNLSYDTPNNCWSNDHKWGGCDITTTLLALMSNISEKNKELALEYLKTELIIERSGEMYVGKAKNITDSAIYDYVVDNQNITSWMRYKQNNVGSWGNNSDLINIMTTGFSLLGLHKSGFNRTNEVIEDAEKWVNDKGD